MQSWPCFVADFQKTGGEGGLLKAFLAQHTNRQLRDCSLLFPTVQLPTGKGGSPPLVSSHRCFFKKCFCSNQKRGEGGVDWWGRLVNFLSHLVLLLLLLLQPLFFSWSCEVLSRPLSSSDSREAKRRKGPTEDFCSNITHPLCEKGKARRQGRIQG